MAVIVGDKLKLSNYSYLLTRDGKGFVDNLQSPERRDREEKLIDAVDIDWRPFRFKNFSYVSTSGKATYTYVTEAGDLFDTERLIDWISYSYSMGKNLDFYGYIFHNRQTNLTIDFARPTMLTNIGWVDKDSRIIGYTFWPAVGSISQIKTLDKTGCNNVFINSTGEIFNDYKNNIASGTYAHAEGYMTNASGNVSHAEGFNTYAEGNYSHSEGVNTHASGDYSHASGYNAIASGSYSFAHGDAVKAEGTFSTAFGFHAVASGSGSFATAGGYKIINGEKCYTWAAGTGSHAEGIASYAGGDYSHAEGDNSYAIGSYSHAEGYKTNAIGDVSHSEGVSTIASGDYSHAEGESTESSGKDSHSEGVSTIASGDYSHAEGSASQSTGLASHAEGQLSEARGAASHTEGFQTLAIGDYSHAEGESTTASGKDSHAEGYNNTTTANYSHIEGSDNRMNQFSTISHVEGVSNEVNNSNITHVEGESNIVNNSDNSHIGGYGNQITGTSSSIIFGSDNTATSSTNITVFGKDNEVTAKKSAVIGTLSKINSSSEYSQVFGTNSYSTKSYITIVGNNTYSSGSYSILIGNNIGTSKENSALLGTYISVGNNSSVPVSIGRNIFSDYESPLSIGINIINNGRSGSTAIGYGLLLNNVNGQKFVTGKFNEALPVGYQFAIGDGQSNTQRHNAFVTTDNNWSYVTALATYINNITTTEQNIAITYETNFVHIKSFNEIKRGVEGKGGLENKDTNTYNLNFNTYILPTKRYVDKLLAAKDVFRFAGTFTPTDTTWTTDLKDHTVRGSWKPSVTPRTDLDNDQQYSYSYSDKDFSAGAVWKVTSTGWFGSTYVMGGDLVISYDDAAQNNNDKGWAVIDTQIAFMENYGTYSTYKGNGALLNDSDKDLRNFFITNINLSDTGYLTYTYAGILTEYRTDSSSMNARGLITKDGDDNNKKFLSNISLIRHDDRIELAYTYTDFLTCYTSPAEAQYTNIDVMENANLQFVYNVYLSTDGILSYSKYTMRGFKHHHHISGAYNWSYAYLSYDTGDDLTYIVSNIHFTYDGHLSYTYTVLSNLRNHHRTRTYTFPDFDNDTRTNESLRVLTNVNLDSNGNLTYTGYNVTNLLNHHHQSHTTNSYNTHKTLLWDNTYLNDDGFGFIGDIQLSADGKLTYIASYVTGLRKHHDTVDMTYTVARKNGSSYTQTYNLSGAYIGKEAYLNLYDNKFGFISYVNLDDKGTLTYTVSYVENLRTHHETYHYAPKDNTIHVDNNSNNRGTSYTGGIDDFTFVKDVNLSAEGKLTYYYQKIDKVRTHHNTKTPTTTSYITVHKDNFTYDDSASYSSRTEVNEVKIIDNINIDPYGTLTYTVSYVNQLRLHHDNQSKNSLTCAYVSTHKADFEHANEKLRIDTYTGGAKSTSNPEITEESDRILFINNVNLSKEGKLTYTAKQISRLRDHHDTQATTPIESPITLHANSNLTTSTKVTHETIDSTRTGTENSADKDELVYIGNVHLDKSGKLTYTYTKVSKLRSHHDNISYTTVNYSVDERKVKDSSTLSDGMKIITEVNLSNKGTLSYTSYNVTNLKHHHHTLAYIHNGDTGGRNSYNYERDIDVDGAKYNATDDVDNSNRKIQFLTYAYLSSDGDLRAYYATISNIRRHHHTLSEVDNKRAATSEQNFNAYTAIADSDSHKVLSYAWVDPYGYFTAYYYTLTNLSAHHATGSTQGNDLTAYSWNASYTKVSDNLNSITDGIKFVDGLYLNKNGKLTYHYTYIGHLRHHHSYEGSQSTTYDVGEFNVDGNDDFGFISGVSMTTDGRLTYTTSSISNLKSHHGTTHDFGYAYDVFTSNSEGCNSFGFISHVNLDANGHFTYKVSSITDLRKHHSDGFPVPSTNAKGNNFVTDVSLSENGYLTGTFGSFGYSGTHNTTGDKNFSAGAEQKINVVTGIKIDGAGQISYSYSEVKNTRNHHTTGTKTAGTDLAVISKAWSYTPFSYTAGSNAHDNAYTDAITFLDGVDLNLAGTLTYHYTKIDHLRSHHRGRFVANVDENNIDKLGQNGHFAFIDSVSLSPEGELTATSKTVEIPNKVNDADHSDESDHSGSSAKLDHTLTIKHGANGEATNVLTNWDGSSNATVNLNNHGTAAVSSTSKTLDFSNKFYVVTGVTLDETGYLHPSMTTYTLPTQNHHTGSITEGHFVVNASMLPNGTLTGTTGTFGANKGTELTGLNICTGSSKLSVITGATIDSDGKFSYSFGYIVDNLYHHSGSVNSSQITTSPGFSGTFKVVNRVTLNPDGQLSGDYVTITMPSQAHHTNDNKTSSSGHFISYNYISSTGTLNRTFGSFSNSHNHTGTVATRTSKGDKHTHQSGDVIVVTYNYIDSSGKVTNRYETIELKNSIFILNNNLNEIYNNPNPTYNTTFTRSLTLTQTDGTGAGSKNATITRLWDNIWESNVS